MKFLIEHASEVLQRPFERPIPRLVTPIPPPQEWELALFDRVSWSEKDFDVHEFQAAEEGGSDNLLCRRTENPTGNQRKRHALVFKHMISLCQKLFKDASTPRWYFSILYGNIVAHMRYYDRTFPTSLLPRIGRGTKVAYTKELLEKLKNKTISLL